MGSPSSEAGRNAYEGPQREVTVPAFAIGVHEVTRDEWNACVAEGGCPDKGYSVDGSMPALVFVFVSRTTNCRTPRFGNAAGRNSDVFPVSGSTTTSWPSPTSTVADDGAEEGRATSATASAKQPALIALPSRETNRTGRWKCIAP